MLQVGHGETDPVDKSLLHKSDGPEILLSYPPNLLRKPRESATETPIWRFFTAFRAFFACLI